jgi:hypothetical protein
MRQLLIVTTLAAALAGCGSGDQTSEAKVEAKVEAAFARLGADRATIGQQRVIDGNFGPLDQVVDRTIYLVPKHDGKTYWIVDSTGEIFDGYYAFLRDNTLSR